MNQKIKTFLLLSLATLFSCLLVAYRLYYIGFDLNLLLHPTDLLAYEGAKTFIFLIWNLFLAWIPYLISLFLPMTRKWKFQKISAFVLLFSWLLFFPNAPYIITDLLHLKARFPVPLWYDVLMIFSFAWTGLLLGYCSLLEVQIFLKKLFSTTFTWFITGFAIFLCSLGIYIGRFQRWNSWDLFSNPSALFRDIGHTLLTPMQHLETLGISIVLFGFLSISYLTLNHLSTIKPTTT